MHIVRTKSTWLVLLVLCWPGAWAAGQQGGADGPGPLEELGGPAGKDVEELAQLVQFGSPAGRAEAIWRLARLENDRSVGPIAGLIAKADPELRPHIAIGLGWLGPRPAAASGAIRRFLEDPSDFTRGTTVWALGRMGGADARKAVEPMAGSTDELVRFLTQEALATLDGKPLLPAGPLTRPLKGATVLVVSEFDALAMARLFGGPLTDGGVRLEAVTVGPLNPTMGYRGGLAAKEEQRFSKFLAFTDGRPTVDVVVLTPIYAHELPAKIRWELWNYVRRGGKLITTDVPLRRFDVIAKTTGEQKLHLRFQWTEGIFDSLLPAQVARGDQPFLDGAAAESRGLRFGQKATGRGAVVVLGQGGAGAVRLADLPATPDVTWRNMAFWALVGKDRANDPVLWAQMIKWLLEGPESLPASAALVEAPALRAGAAAELAVRVKNYCLAAADLRVTAALVGADGGVVARGTKDVRLDKGGSQDVTVPLAVPAEACEGGYVLRTTLSVAVAAGGDGRTLQQGQTAVQVRPCVSMVLTAPAQFGGPGEKAAVSVRVEKAGAPGPGAGPLEAAELRCSLADGRGRPLLRRQAAAEFAEPAKEFGFEFVLPDLPAGGYGWLAEVWQGGRLLGRTVQPLARMEPWRFRKELVVAPFGFGPLQPRDEIDALRSIGMTTYGLPASMGAWTYAIESPTFLPRRGWPADLLDGAEGDEWRKLGQRYRNHPWLTLLDTTEESDLAIGSNLTSYGDVEREGHEQFRVYLQRKYRTLSGLNAAWKTDYADWSQVGLRGAVTVSGGEVLYTSRIGGTDGEMVPVPKELDPARGVTSRQPYIDQNAWRWYYLWLLLEVRHAAFGQADGFHAITPGGAMGLHAPFDYPHFRIYSGDALGAFSRRATFGRPTYGTRPHVVLIGVADRPEAIAKTCWQAVAGGGRFLMPYGAGDNYGARLLNSDYTPTEAGLAFGRTVRRIKAKQEVLLATHNDVDRRVLLLSEGYDGYRSVYSQELYDALLGSGVLPDYGTDLAGRKLVVTGAGELPPATVKALRRFVEQGGTLLVLAAASGELLAELGLRPVRAELPKDFAAKVTFAEPAGPGGPAGPAKELSFTSRYRAGIEVPSGGQWAPLATYADAGAPPAMLKGKLGAGTAFLANFEYRYGEDLAARYAAGGAVRGEAEAHRKAVAAVLAAAGVPGAFQTADGAEGAGAAAGGPVPYVAVEPLATADGSQKYLLAFADDRLPKGLAAARGLIRVGTPGVQAIYDVYAERAAALRDGAFAFDLPPGEGTVFSLLTEEPGSVELTAEKAELGPGGPLRLAVRVLRADGKLSECEHALDVRVFGPAGKEIEPLAQRASIRGRGVVSLLPSWSDGEGPWRIVAGDLTTGRQGEARVTMSFRAAAPPLEPTGPFAPAAGADVTLLVEPLAELNAFANFATIAATVRSSRPGPVSLRVRLRIPPECLLSGEPAQDVRLTPESPAKTIAWPVFISRRNAVGFYYSDKTSGFFTDSLYPAIYAYRGKPTPAIELEAAGGAEGVTFQAGDGAITRGTTRLVYRVPIRMNPFERGPAALNTFEDGKVGVSVRNATGSPLAGQVLLAAPEQWAPVPRELGLAVEPGKAATLTVTPRLRQDAPIDPGLVEVPIRIRIAGRELDAGSLTVEHKLPRRWLVRRGSPMPADKDSLPFSATGPFPQSDGWRSIQAEAQMSLAEVMGEAPSVAYAATCIDSPRPRVMRVELAAVGGRARAWLNGEPVATDAKAPPAAPGQADQATDKVLAELASPLRAGKNVLVIEVFRTDKRFRGCTVRLLDADGKTLRDIRPDVPATAPAVVTP